MIYVNIIGGLGNQMFQYAAARNLAERLGCDFKLDISAFEQYKLHKYCLDKFNIVNKFADSEEVAEFKEKEKQKGLRKLVGTFTGKKYAEHEKLFKEVKMFNFDERFLNLTDGVYLSGYWQHEKYFSSIEDIIRSDFQVKASQKNRNKEVAQLIEDSRSVSVHIRRGDYVADHKTLKVHGICSLDYYEEALRIIKEKLDNPTYFIFSDDHKWVKDNLKIEGEMVFVDHNDSSTNYEDLRLMSQCKHNIIANSTFSWWGAWLNDNKSKIVIAPNRWMASGNYRDIDIVPHSWAKI